jgi:Ca2+-binding EF-hand superfamily protein
MRWILTNWVDGPTLLLLDENFQRVRANAAPLFAVLDRNEDGSLSAAEIESAEESLWKYDASQDEVLSLVEITKAAERTPAVTEASSVIPPRIPLEQLANAMLFRRLREYYKSPLARFDRDADEVISAAELDEQQKAAPDLIVHVAFDTQDANRSRLEVIDNHPSGESQATVRETSVTLRTRGTLVEFSAVQSRDLSGTDQISFGAVRDGFPLLAEMDLNEDGRLTIREVRQVAKRIGPFDDNRDGVLAKSEIPPTLRVSFGLGPIVHRQLVAVRTVHPAVPSSNIKAPDWFVRMDRNQDGDLTIREFLGGKEQFTSLDTDRDGLISGAEAIASKQ